MLYRKTFLLGYLRKNQLFIFFYYCIYIFIFVTEQLFITFYFIIYRARVWNNNFHFYIHFNIQYKKNNNEKNDYQIQFVDYECVFYLSKLIDFMYYIVI